MPYVFDASFIGALIIPDEKNSRVDKGRADIGENEEIAVPQLFWYEIANIFSNLVRQRRYTCDEAMQFFPNFTTIRLTTDSETGVAYSQRLLRLCNDYSLSSYDSSYLELADRKKAVLCTLDKELLTAAKRHGIKVIS
jgi:predicted nucleic acid-binding protein